MSDAGGFAAEQLKSYVERIERLETEIKALNDDKRDVYAEAKANGFDVKVLKQVVRLRKQDADERHEQETILDLYLAALGMIPGRDEREPSRVHPHTREERSSRAKSRSSEAMTDHKAQSEELARLGLISAKDHAENVRLADAVATKFGADVEPDVRAATPAHDPDTGEIIETRAAEEDGCAAESREAEGASPPLAEASAPATPQSGEPSSETAASPSPPITRQIAVFDGAGRAIGGEASRAGPKPYPLDERGLEYAGEIPSFMRRA